MWLLQVTSLAAEALVAVAERSKQRIRLSQVDSHNDSSTSADTAVCASQVLGLPLWLQLSKSDELAVASVATELLADVCADEAGDYGSARQYDVVDGGWYQVLLRW